MKFLSSEKRRTDTVTTQKVEANICILLSFPFTDIRINSEHILSKLNLLNTKLLLKLQNKMHKIVITNEDLAFETFLKILYVEKIIKGENHLRCRKGRVKATTGNKFKQVELDFTPYEGEYITQFKQNKIQILVERGEHVLTTECRQINYLKSVTIQGPTLEIVKQFVDEIFQKLEATEESDEKIMIYENYGGYWEISKEKKPRTLESVIFKEEFIQSVLDDIQEFTSSEQWYGEMGIPYKRSYLLYGPPGTGKSSFAQALAGHIKYSICYVNCSDSLTDFDFNNLLNFAPQKSILLIEDVDSIFSERKNSEKLNSLTFSGFLNAIDGVRSQEGRIIMMTTNYKDRLDPALLRPGRVDEMYEINYATHFQIEKLCYRFFKDEALAKKFAAQLPEYKFSMSMIQGFLLKHRKNPYKIIQHSQDLIQSDENIKIQQFLDEINCQQALNDCKLEECYTLAHARRLPKITIEKMIDKLSDLQKGRFLECVRFERKSYIKTAQELRNFIDQNYKDEQVQRNLKKFVQESPKIRTFYQIRDKASDLLKPKKDQ